MCQKKTEDAKLYVKINGLKFIEYMD